MKKYDSTVTITDEFNEKNRLERRYATIMNVIPVFILAGLIAVFSILSPQFFTFENLFSNIINQMAINLILGVGITFVIILGSINLSVEGMMSVAGCICGLLIQNNKNSNNFGFLAVIIVLIMMVGFGFLTGWVHVKLKLPSFIVTFAMGFITLGLAAVSYKGKPATITDQLFLDLYFNKFLSLNYLTWISFAVLILGLILERKTAFGRYVYAIGENESIPKMSGVNVGRVKILVFVFAGFCMGIAGILGAAKLATAQVLIGEGYLFPTLTAIVIGGTPMSGGKGGILNTVIGTLIVTVLNNGMIMLSVPSIIQEGILGLIILVAVILSTNKDARLVVK